MAIIKNPHITVCSTLRISSDQVAPLKATDGYIMGSDNLQRQGVAEASIVMGIGMLLSSIFVVQRLYVKAFVRKHLGWDDGTIIKPSPLTATDML